MDKDFESYINQIVNDLDCNNAEKQDIRDEISDHLKLLRQEYIEKGLTNAEATHKAIELFGDTNQIQNGYKKSLSPYNKIFKISTWILFSLFSFIIMWKLILERVIQRLYDHFVNGISYNRYFSNPAESTSYFDITVWEKNANIIPFRTIFNYIVGFEHYNFNIIIDNTLGNVLIFFPLGIFLPILFKRYTTFNRAVTVSLITSFIIEALQLILRIGQFDIDDVILNGIGSIIGFLVVKLIIKIPNLYEKTGIRLG
jgi:glycopeptide antibiotics resistance protein